jgi:hypothetical protein
MMIRWISLPQTTKRLDHFLDSAATRYSLSAMKINSQTYKNTQTINDESTPLKQADEK